MCKHKLKTEQRKIWSLEYWNIFGHWNIWSAVVLSCFIQVYGIYMYIYSKNRNFPMGISIDMRQVFFVVVVCVCVACPSPSPPSRIHIMNKFNFTQQINQKKLAAETEQNLEKCDYFLFHINFSTPFFLSNFTYGHSDFPVFSSNRISNYTFMLDGIELLNSLSTVSLTRKKLYLYSFLCLPT